MSRIHVETFMIGTQNSRVSNNGSTATANLQPQLSIPTTATSVAIALRNSYVWNTFVNVSPEFGQLLRIQDGKGNPEKVITIPTGQYSIETFNDSFARESIANNADWVVNGECKLIFEADEAQQKIYILNKTTIEFVFDWDVNYPTTTRPTMWRLLGFNAGTKTDVPKAINTTLGSIHVYAPNTAQFNIVNQVYITCSLVSRGIRDGGEYKGILAQMPITEPPGHLMVYEPDKPAISEPSLIGSHINNIQVTLTNEKGELIRTPGNDWFVTIDLSYDIID